MTSEGSHHNTELQGWLVEARERRDLRRDRARAELQWRRRFRARVCEAVVASSKGSRRGPRALFIGPVGDPWRAGQGCRRGVDSGRGRTRESPGPSRGRGRPRQAGPACRWAAGGGGVGLGPDEEMGRKECEKGCGRGKRMGRRGRKKRGKNAGPAWGFRLKEAFFLQEIQTNSI